MDTVHNLSPQIFVKVSGIFRDFFIVVITGPYSTCIIWCVAYKPEVIVILGSTCLTGNCHIIKLAGCTCTFIDNIFHGTCEKISSAVFDNRSGNRRVLDENIAVMVEDLCIVDRLNIIAVVCNSCICGTEFNVFDTVGNSAKCSCKVGITPYISVGIFICLSSMCKCGKSEIIQIFKTKRRSDLLQAFDRNNIDGVLDRFTDRCLTAVSTACIVDRRTVRIFIWFIHKCSGQCITFLIESRRIGRYNLKGRTRLSGCIGCTVQGKAGCFFTTAADQSFDIACVLVDNSHGRLRLWCEIDTLGNNSASVSKDISLVLVNILLSFFRRTEKKIKFGILITEIKLKHFLTVVDLLSGRGLNSQCVIQFILSISRIVVRICIFLIQNLLDVGIKSCHDLQTATVEKISSLCFGVTLDIHQVVNDLVGDFIFKICVDSAFFLSIFKLCCLNTGVNIII